MNQIDSAASSRRGSEPPGAERTSVQRTAREAARHVETEVRVLARVRSRLLGELRRRGVLVTRMRKSGFALRAALLDRSGVELLLDVGAHMGQYGRDMRTVGYEGRIVSFEPLSGPYAALRRVAEADGSWMALNTALGATRASQQINVSGCTASSSFLPMGDLHSDAAPGSRYVSTETVDVRTLDESVAELGLSEGQRLALKVDVQGYEREVLEGAHATVDRVVYLEMEMSLDELYEGQPLLSEMLCFAEGLGFTLVAIEPVFSDPRTSRLLQVDGVFLRDPSCLEK